MMQLMRNGGMPMWFILLFGLVALVSAALFARRPVLDKVRFIASMGLATLFSVGAGTAAALAAVCSHVTSNPEWAKSPDLHLILLEGVGEALAPAVLGFTLLSLVAFVTAVGLRRLPQG